MHINIYVLYIPGCPINLHYKNILSKEKAYEFYRNGEKTPLMWCSIIEGLEYTKYDYSGFSAKTSDLLSEANSNKSTYSLQINAAADEINSLRTSAGVEKLTLDQDLCTAACVRATEMAYSGKIGSKRPSGSSCYTVLTDLGIDSKSSFEITSKGQSDAKAALTALEEKNANVTQLKNESYNKIGIGVAANPEGIKYYCFILIKQ